AVLAFHAADLDEARLQRRQSVRVGLDRVRGVAGRRREVRDAALELLRLLAMRLLPRIDLRELGEGARRLADAVGRGVLALGEGRRRGSAGARDPVRGGGPVALGRRVLVLLRVEANGIDLADLEVERLETIAAAAPRLLELLAPAARLAPRSRRGDHGLPLDV